MTKIKLFCLPYAGGSASVYYKWSSYFGSAVEVCPIELTGRGLRINEARYDTLDEAIDDIMKIIDPHNLTEPYALFGHSMGALLSFGLAQRIRALGLPPPQHVFFSGKGDPCMPRKKEHLYHLLGEGAFREKILELGGTPREFFKHPELTELFLPLLRNDFRLASTTFQDSKISRLNYNITVFLGKEDEITGAEAENWRHYTSEVCSIHYFNGGHFFLNQEAPLMAKIMVDHLQAAPAFDKHRSLHRQPVTL